MQLLLKYTYFFCFSRHTQYKNASTQVPVARTDCSCSSPDDVIHSGQTNSDTLQVHKEQEVCSVV